MIRLILLSAVILFVGCAQLQEQRQEFMSVCLSQAGYTVIDCAAIEYYNAELQLTKTVNDRYDAGLIHSDQKDQYLARADEANAIVDEAYSLGNLSDIQGQKTSLEALERVLRELEARE